MTNAHFFPNSNKTIVCLADQDVLQYNYINGFLGND